MKIRDSKISILLLASFFLLFASFLVLCTWGYNFYTKIEKTSAQFAPISANKKGNSGVQDSMLKSYAEVMKKIDDRLNNSLLNTDSIQKNINNKLSEYNKLQEEFTNLMKNPQRNQAIEIATRDKINTLQEQIKQLQQTNLAVTEENKKLSQQLEQLKQSSTNKPTNTNIQSVLNSKKDEGKIDNSIALIVSELDLSLSDDGDQTGKVNGSFYLKNNNAQNSIELYIVIIQPNGKVLQKSDWESGSFNSKDGKKIYSCKINTDNTKGEVKKMNFSISSENLIRGNYSFIIYHNGLSIAKLNKQLT